MSAQDKEREYEQVHEEVQREASKLINLLNKRMELIEQRAELLSRLPSDDLRQRPLAELLSTLESNRLRDVELIAELRRQFAIDEEASKKLHELQKLREK